MEIGVSGFSLVASILLPLQRFFSGRVVRGNYLELDHLVPGLTDVQFTRAARWVRRRRNRCARWRDRAVKSRRLVAHAEVYCAVAAARDAARLYADGPGFLDLPPCVGVAR